MDVFNIRDYIWNVFEICQYNKINNIRIALELFLKNIEIGRNRYPGCTNINYGKLTKLYSNSTKAYIRKQKIIFNKIIHIAYGNLSKAFRENDKCKFEKYCNIDISKL